MPRTPEGDRLRDLIREVFGVPLGSLPLKIDYASLELRLLVQGSGKPLSA